VSNIAAVSIVN